MSYVETIDGRTWESYDGMASEHELGDFMYGLIRELKPKVVLETGCYIGCTTRRMAEAVRDNGIGLLHTCDIEEQYCEFARNLRLPVEVHQCSGLELAAKIDGVGVAFLDSSGDRVQEALALKMRFDGIIVLHDANRPTFTDIVRLKGWRYIKFGTPRGLAIFQMD